MITLLHGDDITKSRAEFIRLKTLDKSKEVRTLDGKTIDESLLMQALSSSSLFGGDTLVAIESLFSAQGKKTKKIETLAKCIVEQSANVDVLMWEEKEVGKTVLTHVGKMATIKLFKLPAIIFQLLDSIKPRNNKTLVTTYQQIVITEPPELVHFMLIKRVRQLLEIAQGNQPSGVAPWQLSRLTNQAHSFTIDGLLGLYKKLLTNDLAMKTGTSVLPIEQSTELLLATL